jgi:hypothetical protein
MAVLMRGLLKTDFTAENAESAERNPKKRNLDAV